MNLGRYSLCLRLMIDGVASRPFSARTLAPSLSESQKQPQDAHPLYSYNANHSSQTKREKTSRKACQPYFFFDRNSRSTKRALLQAALSNPWSTFNALTSADRANSRRGALSLSALPPQLKLDELRTAFS